MNSFLSGLLALLARLFGGQPPSPPPEPPAPHLPDSDDEPAQIVRNRVLMIVFDPIMEDGRTLRETMLWNAPDHLANEFAREILNDSHGMARYEIFERVVVNEFPLLKDGFRYTPETYRAVLQGGDPPHQPEQADYNEILQRFDILQRVAQGQIDEVWLFAFPYAGFYESVMAGKDAFWCNAPALSSTQQCPRRFVVMGFSCERGLGEMLEAFGHRVESIMAQTFRHLQDDANLWERFTRYDKIAPGQAAVGNIHFAPNSERDYDWGNPRFVPSECYDWLNFPDFQGDVRQVNAAEWGGGDILLHHRWWLEHIPHVAGRKNGIHNNWWQYILRPENVGVR